jgi:hypothetical protein
LRKRLEEDHVGCVEVLAEKVGADEPDDTPNVTQAMMLFQQVKDREKASQDRVKVSQDQVKSTNKVSLKEKENDVAQKKV